MNDVTQTSELPRILLVCASALTAKSFNRLLSERFSIEQVEAAEQGWEQLQQSAEFSVLVCQLALALDDSALLERIRQAASESLSRLPVLLLVGETDEEALRDRAFAAGATDFIHMPFSRQELEARIRLHARLFGLYQNQAALEVGGDNSPVDLLNTLVQEKYFYTRLEQELSFSARHKSSVSACLLQIDDADGIEDQYGKKLLRAVLRAISGVIETRIRREDSYAYLGDATFALLYPVTNGLGAQVATQRLVETIESTTLRHDDQEIKVTLSGGLTSLLPDEELDVEHVMSVLRQRLDKSLRQGGRQIVSSKGELEQGDISLEQALNMIRYNRTDVLKKQIPRLVDEMLPLLAFIKQQNSLEFDRIIDELDDED